MAQDPYSSFADPVGGSSQTRQQAPRQRPRQQIRFADDHDALTRTVIGEAGREPDDGQTAVAAVALNRARSRGLTPSQVVLERNQFEPWGNAETTQRLLSISPDSAEYRRASAAVERALAGQDPTGGASHFYSPTAQSALGRQAPSWDDGNGFDIGRHRFFRIEGQGQPQAAAQQASMPMPQGGDAYAGIAEPVSAPQSTGPKVKTLQTLVPGEGVTPEWLASQGVNTASLTENDMRAMGFAPNYDTGQWEVERLVPVPEDQLPSEGYQKAVEQERATLAERERLGVDQYDNPDFIDAMSSPINDEIGAALGYGGQSIANLLRTIRGEESEVSASDRAGAIMNLNREGTEQYQEENPLEAATGQVLGGFAFAPARGAAAASALGRVLQGSAIGAGYGVADGEGVEGRLVGGGTGAGVGAAFGAAVEAAPVYARALTRDIQGLRGQGPRLSADESRVAQVLNRSLQRDEMAPADLIQNLNNGPAGQLPFEAGGRNVMALAEAAASTPGRAQTRIATALGDRSATATDRVSQSLGREFGANGGGLAAIEESIAARGTAAKEGIAQFGNDVIALSDDAISAVRSPRAQAAIAEAIENRRSSLDPNVRNTANRLGSLVGDALDNPASARMSVQDAQELSYALREAGTSAFTGGDGARGRALTDLARGIRDNARDQSVPYRTWLREFGDASDNIEALRLGRGVLTGATEGNRTSAAQLRTQVADMSNLERDNFRRGVGEALVERARSVSGGVGAMRQLARSAEFGDRVRLAFPTEEGFESFMRSAADEVRFQNNSNQILGNSRTANRQALRDDLAPGGAGVDEMMQFGRQAAGGNFMGALGTAANSVLSRLPNTRQNLLTRPATNEVLGEIFSDPAALQRLLQEFELSQTVQTLLGRNGQGIRALGPGVSGAAASLP